MQQRVAPFSLFTCLFPHSPALSEPNPPTSVGPRPVHTGKRPVVRHGL